MQIYVFGNELVAQDSLAKKIAKSIIDENLLPNVDFVFCEDPHELLDKELDNLVILDVAQNIDSVMMLTSTEQLEHSKIVSLHDFDLGYFLKLMKTTGALQQINIIAIPWKGEVNNYKDLVVKEIKSILESRD